MIYLFHKRQNAYFAIRFSISVPVYLLLADPLSPFPLFCLHSTLQCDNELIINE